MNMIKVKDSTDWERELWIEDNPHSATLLFQSRLRQDVYLNMRINREDIEYLVDRLRLWLETQELKEKQKKKFLISVPENYICFIAEAIDLATLKSQSSWAGTTWEGLEVYELKPEDAIKL